MHEFLTWCRNDEGARKHLKEMLTALFEIAVLASALYFLIYHVA